MKSQRTTTLAATGFFLLLAGCERPPQLGPGEADFGNSVKQNIEAQVIYPDARPEPGAPPFSGERAGLAMERYRTDDVKKPRSLRTSDLLRSSGSGGN